ncbi:MAG TPA: polyprenyl synthetase family protein [Bacteroidia bacterium]|nr:polyprenyl synthetase family protein [Bacteroidia bacterium]
MNKIIEYQTYIEKALKDKQYGSNPKELYEPIRYIMSLGGKRLRPVLVCLGCDFFDQPFEKAIHAALAIEIFHNFTLVHDDLMDKAPLRRNQQTVHEKWNGNIAILAGDAMMIAAYQELNKLDVKIIPELIAVFSQTALQVCEGQQLDMNYEKVQKVSIQQYLKMIELKTAVLVGASLKMGAIIGNARAEDANSLYDFGKHIGIAFQLQDDILDVYADEKKFGKQKGGDIIANKKTYLLLKAIEMAEGNRYMKEELNQWINAPHFDAAEKVEAVTNIYNFLNVKELARNEMKKHYDTALACLKSIPVNEQKKQVLIDFAESLMVREV